MKKQFNYNIIFGQIWINPKRALTLVFQTDPDKYFLPLFFLGGFAYSIDTFSIKHKGDIIYIIFLCIITGGLFGRIGYYFLALSLSKTGKWLNGSASTKMFLTVIAWSLVPQICSVLFRVPELMNFGVDFFNSDISFASDSNFIFFIIIILLQTILQIWSFVILLKGTSLIQRFTTGRALLNISLPYLIFITPLVTASLLYYYLIIGILVGSVFVSTIIITRQEMKVEKIEQKMLHSRMEVQEQILTNISQEMHDNIKSELVYVKLCLNTISINEPKTFEKKIEQANKGVDTVIEGLKFLSRKINPGYISKTGLLQLIEDDLNRIENTGQLTVKVITEGTIEKQEELEQKAWILFGIFQNAVNNILEHAKATTIKVILSYFPELFVMEISDNGKGFDLSKSTGLGLANINEQVKLIGATLKIQSIIGKGTTLKVSVASAVNLI